MENQLTSSCAAYRIKTASLRGLPHKNDCPNKKQLQKLSTTTKNPDWLTLAAHYPIMTPNPSNDPTHQGDPHLDSADTGLGLV